jgi:xylulokinase
MAKAYLLGYDIGSSSIKATLLDAEKQNIVASATSPKTELEIIATNPGWAEQDPAIWWDHVKSATAEILRTVNINARDIEAIGISYQMHGLVIVDKNQKVLCPSILWCDSRAVDIGNRAFAALGRKKCLKNLLNSPGNFTASKLKWVMENRQEIYKNIFKFMLPGEFIAMKMTGEIKTTPSGLSEAILWDFQKKGLADFLIKYYEIDHDLIPEQVPVFSTQGELTNLAATELGLAPGIKISYRAGDQLNNALSLNVLNPGEIAATAGTSGVIYGIDDKPRFDDKSRVNSFVHVNYSKDDPRYGIMVCINGTGSLNRWAKHTFIADSDNRAYDFMNKAAMKIQPGSNGLTILPYGNGAERTLGNYDIKSSIHGLEFNIHNRPHFYRAAQEGIVFAMNYGLGIMRGMGVAVTKIRAGHANMFLSPLFASIFAAVTETEIELFDTDGSRGAAIGAGIGAGVYKNYSEAFTNLKAIKRIEPDTELTAIYKDIYYSWKKVLQKNINK